MESPLRGDTHGGFGERPGETDQQQCRHRAPGRLIRSTVRGVSPARALGPPGPSSAVTTPRRHPERPGPIQVGPFRSPHFGPSCPPEALFALEGGELSDYDVPPQRTTGRPTSPRTTPIDSGTSRRSLTISASRSTRCATGVRTASGRSVAGSASTCATASAMCSPRSRNTAASSDGQHRQADERQVAGALPRPCRA
jgi:hypothetical protein